MKKMKKLSYQTQMKRKKKLKVLVGLKNEMVSSFDDMPSKNLAEKLKRMIEGVKEEEQEVVWVRDVKLFAVDSLMMMMKKAVDLLELPWFQIL